MSDSELGILQWLSSNEELIIVSTAILAGTLIAIIAVIAHYISSIRLGERQLELKESMIERGMSAEEIERVLQAGRNKCG